MTARMSDSDGRT